MRTEQLTMSFEPLQKLRARLGSIKPVYSPQLCYITVRSKAVLLMWFSVMLVLVSVSVLFSPSICLDDLSLVEVAEWPSFGKELLIWLIVFVVVPYFGYEGGTVVLIAPAPGHCLHFICNYCHPISDFSPYV